MTMIAVNKRLAMPLENDNVISSHSESHAEEHCEQQKQNPHRKHILIFDSGVGGLSISQEISTRLPAIKVSYLGDNAFFPYGTKAAPELQKRIKILIEQANTQLKPDIIVIACNTASTIALDALRQSIDTPIVGVVPAIKPAAQHSTSKVIGLLATPGTVARDYTRRLVEDYAGHCEVIHIGSSHLVELAEKKLQGSVISRTEIKEISDILSPFFSHTCSGNVDAIVLGCTHFPLIKKELMEAAPLYTGIWIDSGEAISRRVESLLNPKLMPLASTSDIKHPTTNHKQPENQSYWTKLETLNPDFLAELEQRGFTSDAFIIVPD
jgi:glutamate racemase